MGHGTPWDRNKSMNKQTSDVMLPKDTLDNIKQKSGARAKCALCITLYDNKVDIA